jgi:predicted Zn-dependent protease
MTMRKGVFFLFASLLVLWIGCSTTPYTGRSQLMLISEGQEVGIGEEAYRHILRDSVLLNHPEALRIVRKVGERIAQAANKPDYKWEFRVIDDPEMVNAFAVPGGKVAVYTGIFPVARDEAGLAVILGHEVAHALARHAGERMSQSQLLGAGLAIAGASGINSQLLQALGLGASVGVILPFSRSQESEADRIGLILMAKAGYDPRVSLELWERMEKRESTKDRSSPPEFLSTHPGYETRTQQLRAFISEALPHFRPTDRTPEALPSLPALDSPSAKAERELLKRIQAVDRQAADPRGEKAVVEALGHTLRMNPSLLYQERQQLRLGHGHYAALRGISFLGRSPLRRIVADYQSGAPWSDLAQSHGSRLTDLISWLGEFRRTAAAIQGQLRTQPLRPGRLR